MTNTRIFYSPTQYTKHVIEMNDAIGNSDDTVTEIDYLLSFKHIHENNKYDNYYVRPIAIKVVGIEHADEDESHLSIDKMLHEDIIINVSKSQYTRMKKYNESQPDAYFCLHTDTTLLKTFNGIDGDHQYYASKILLITDGSDLHKRLHDIESKKASEYTDHIDVIENTFTL